MPLDRATRDILSGSKDTKVATLFHGCFLIVSKYVKYKKNLKLINYIYMILNTFHLSGTYNTSPYGTYCTYVDVSPHIYYYY